MIPYLIHQIQGGMCDKLIQMAMIVFLQRTN